MTSLDTSIRAIRLCDGGERVENGNTLTVCHYCSGGVCVSWQACEVPEPEQQREPQVRGLVQIVARRCA